MFQYLNNMNHKLLLLLLLQVALILYSFVMFMYKYFDFGKNKDAWLLTTTITTATDTTNEPRVPGPQMCHSGNFRDAGLGVRPDALAVAEPTLSKHWKDG